MWISEMAAMGGREEHPIAEMATVTIGGEKAAALISGEARGLSTLSPGGLRWLPEAGQEALILCTPEGERFIIGVSHSDMKGLAEGEVYISSKKAVIRLCNDGSIEMEGTVRIHGDLRLNGVSVGGVSDGT